MAVKSITVIDHKQIDGALKVVDQCCTKIINSGGTAYAQISNEPLDNRSSHDNAKFHAIMTDIWKQAVFEFVDINGKAKKIVMSEYKFEQCKTLLIVWFIEELFEIGEAVPEYAKVETLVCPRTGRIYNQRGSTKRYSKKFCRLLFPFLWSTGCDGGVAWTDPATKEYESMMGREV